MKKTVNVAIGGCSFIIDEDACNIISEYLDRFKAAVGDNKAGDYAMDELENRIADLLKGKLGGRDVVTSVMASEVIGQLGYPEGYKESSTGRSSENCGQHNNGFGQSGPVRKLFRDPDGKKIAGVCSGLSLFLGIDVVILRVLFLIAMICGTAGLWIYLAIWIAAPEAKTAAEKCELRGIPANAENIRKFTQGQ